MSNKQSQQSKLDRLESYLATQARLAYLRENCPGLHLGCLIHGSRIKPGVKLIALRTAGGLHYYPVKAVK